MVFIGNRQNSQMTLGTNLQPVHILYNPLLHLFAWTISVTRSYTTDMYIIEIL